MAKSKYFSDVGIEGVIKDVLNPMNQKPDEKQLYDMIKCQKDKDKEDGDQVDEYLTQKLLSINRRLNGILSNQVFKYSFKRNDLFGEEKIYLFYKRKTFPRDNKELLKSISDSHKDLIDYTFKSFKEIYESDVSFQFEFFILNESPFKNKRIIITADNYSGLLDDVINFNPEDIKKYIYSKDYDSSRFFGPIGTMELRSPKHSALFGFNFGSLILDIDKRKINSGSDVELMKKHFVDFLGYSKIL